jgi:F420-non-reducing hydrogenase iron-sulfur subunit
MSAPPSAAPPLPLPAALSPSPPAAPVGAGARAAEGRFEPVVIGFTCNWCSYRAADLAGTSRLKYPPNIRLIRLMCSGRLDPTFVLKAFADGADGVMVSGCHPGDCHYVDQNYKTLRRHRLLQRTLEQFGIAAGRLRLTWASAGEGALFAQEITTFVEQVRALGPLRWPTALARDDAAPLPCGPVSDAGVPAGDAEAAAPDGATSWRTAEVTA